MADETPQSNVIDLILKYSGAIAAAAYAGGFVQQTVFAARWGVVDVSLNNSSYLTRGIFLLVLAFGFPLLAVTVHSRRIKGWWFQLALAITVFIIDFFGGLNTGAWVRDSLAWATIGSILAVLTHRALRPDENGFFRVTISQTRMEHLFLVGVFFLIFAGCAGEVEWRSSMEHDPVLRVRLLVSPDAVTGAEQLGFAFPAKSAAQAPALSAPVEILIRGGNNYTIRIGKTHVAVISKDKVWGSRPE